jgi:hypothetical protein
MTRFLGILVATACLSVSGPAARGDDKDATPIIDKAIAALGGEAKLAKAATATWKGSGTITFGENESPVKTTTTVDGLERHRGEMELEINGMPVKGVTVLNGTKAWRKFGDNSQTLDEDRVAATRQSAYLQAVAMTILPLKTKSFKVEAGPDEKVGDKPAAVVKGTGPDGKTFTLYFDKETGLPIRMAATVMGFQGDDVKAETNYSDYKEFDGVKRATKVESKRNGDPFIKMEYSEFKLVEKPEASKFAEPD